MWLYFWDGLYLGQLMSVGLSLCLSLSRYNVYWTLTVPRAVLILYKRSICHIAVYSFCPSGVIYFSHILKDIAAPAKAAVHSAGASFSYTTCVSVTVGTVSFQVLLLLFNMCQPFDCVAQLFESKFWPTISDNAFLHFIKWSPPGKKFFWWTEVNFSIALERISQYISRFYFAFLRFTDVAFFL